MAVRGSCLETDAMVLESVIRQCIAITPLDAKRRWGTVEPYTYSGPIGTLPENCPYQSVVVFEEISVDIPEVNQKIVEIRKIV